MSPFFYSSFPQSSDRVDSKPKVNGSILRFGLVLLLHALVIWLVSGIIIFPAQPIRQTDTTQMQRIPALTKPLVSDLPPSNGGRPGMPAPNLVLPVITTTSSAPLNLPKFSSPYTLPNDLHSAGGGIGTGQGNGFGSDHAGGGRNMGFIFIQNEIHLRYVLDTDIPVAWVDWLFDWYYRNDAIVELLNNGGTATWNGDSVDLERTLFFQLVPDVDSHYPNIHCYILACDFRPKCCSSFYNAIATLRSRHTRLCIMAFDNAPYPGLAEYVKESGGVVVYPVKEGKDAAIARIHSVLP